MTAIPHFRDSYKIGFLIFQIIKLYYKIAQINTFQRLHVFTYWWEN